MGRLEVACRRFALLSGITQEADNYAICVYPRGAAGQRKGMLALVTEPAGDHPAFSIEACRLVHDVLIQQYYTDNSLGLTSGLLKAIDSANSALLEYNYNNNEIAHLDAGQQGAVAVRAGGVRTGRSQVGLTAVLLRPDGAGLYLAQMSPTQAYILHNGQVSALPEPVSWQTQPGKLAVTLRRVPDQADADNTSNAHATWEDEDAPEETLPPVMPPSIPLGNGPGVEVDLLYRRVEPGDLVIVVSSSLARHLSRPLAEELFSHGNADVIMDNLYTLAIERGLAQSHACVLQIGVEATSGVETDLVTHAPPARTERFPTSINTYSELLDPEPSRQPQQPHEHPTKLDPLKMPRQWLMKLRPSEVPDVRHEAEAVPIADIEEPAGLKADPDVWVWDNRPADMGATATYQPTQVLLQRSVEVPPYKVSETNGPAEQEELGFDGWEDEPPALSWIRKDTSRTHGSVDGNTARKHVEELAEPHYSRADKSGTAPSRISRIYPVPTLFDESDRYDDEPLVFPASVSGAQFTRATETEAPPVQRASAWVRNVLPRGLSNLGSIQLGGKRAVTMIPARVLIAAALVVLMVMLLLSVYNAVRSPKQRQVNQFLTQAQQEDLLANQPSALPSERQTHLAKALDLANQALKADPQSKDAALLIEKTETSLDVLQGITRVEPKLLFDLEAASSGSGAPQGAAQALTGTQQPGEIIVQSNDAYVLDREKGSIYRCHIATRDCAAILKSGDDAGGQKVGTLLAMTFRVGNLVALNKDLVSFVFNADTSSWQAQQLGGADGLDRPKDIASYDGNLYLLAAKAAQISKYAAGKYDQPPTDWIAGPTNVDQVKDPVAMSIDGAIYMLLSDGKILVLEGGKVVRTIPAKPNDEDPATQLFTSTDTQDLYLLKPAAGSITRMTKEGQLRATFKPSKASGLTSFAAMTVDEGSGKLYMLAGRQIYEASLRAPAPGVLAPANPGQPAPRPTAAP